MLQQGSVVPLRDGRLLTIGPLLGEGGQGWVHRASPSDGGPEMAVKWYRPDVVTGEQMLLVRDLVSTPAPSPAFLWPTDIIEHAGGFGYAMPLRPDGFRPVSDLLTGRVDAPFSVVIRLCRQLADAFLRLHAEGLVYRDISLGNVFADARTGRVLVCDTDNVGVDGAVRSRVLGTSRFMAPEIVRGEAAPSIATDLYSLSVLIFYLLMVHHPLLGRRELAFACLDGDAERSLFGTDPVFVFDPSDPSNRPDPATHGSVLVYWNLYPEYLRADFVQAFTVGLHDPQARVREGIWRERMARLLDTLVVCSCGAENPTAAGEQVRCWHCGRLTDPTVKLEIDQRTLVLGRDRVVYRHHLMRDYDFDTVVARIVQHPDRPGVWGLRNESGSHWRVRFAAGSTSVVEPGRTVGLADEATIDFGPARATITR